MRDDQTLRNPAYGHLPSRLDDLDGRDVGDLELAAAGLHAYGQVLRYLDREVGALDPGLRIVDPQEEGGAGVLDRDLRLLRQPGRFGIVEPVRPDGQVAGDVLAILADDGERRAADFDSQLGHALTDRQDRRARDLGGARVAVEVAADLFEEFADPEAPLARGSGRPGRVVDDRPQEDEPADQQ